MRRLYFRGLSVSLLAAIAALGLAASASAQNSTVIIADAPRATVR